MLTTLSILATLASVSPELTATETCVIECESQAQVVAQKKKRDGADYQGIYVMVGLAPAATVHLEGFNPNLRYDLETGLGWEYGRRNMVLVGVDANISHYFGRKVPGGGADVVLTSMHGPFYARVGAGVATGVPRSRELYDFQPAIGGVVGLGLQGGGKKHAPLGRVGVDYDVRFDTDFGMNHTVLLTVRLMFF